MKFLELTNKAPAVAMLGMCKNAGKTTVFNRLIREWAESESGILALTSIGRDGEGRDLVTGTYKPPIYMSEGMLAATAEELLPLCDVSREILAATGLYTSLGEIIIFRARSDGFVQLAGPAMVDQLKTLRKKLTGFGAACVMVDGALSRRSPLAGVPDGACILSTGASLDRDMEKVIGDTAYVAGLLDLPECELPGEEAGRVTLFLPDGERIGADSALQIKRPGGPGLLYFSGALTETQAKALAQETQKEEGLTVLVRDGSCLLTERQTYERLQAQGVRFAVRQGTRLAAVAINPVSAGGWRFDREAFYEKMRAAVAVPVLDVMREERS